MAGGGDGTVNWLLTEIIASKIDYTKIVFSALPLGTGNDFAKNLAGNKSPSSKVPKASNNSSPKSNALSSKNSMSGKSRYPTILVGASPKSLIVMRKRLRNLQWLNR